MSKYKHIALRSDVFIKLKELKVQAEFEQNGIKMSWEDFIVLKFDLKPTPTVPVEIITPLSTDNINPLPP